MQIQTLPKFNELLLSENSKFTHSKFKIQNSLIHSFTHSKLKNMERKKAIKAGIFVILVIVLSIWGFSFLDSKNMFTTDQVFYGSYKDVGGLMVSNTVYLNGMKVGMVRDIYFENVRSSQLVVEFSIKKGILIPKGSKAEIVSFDLMGTKAITLKRNYETKEYYNEGDTMVSGIESDLKEQVNQQILPLKAKAEDLILSFDSVLIAVKAIFNDQTRQNLRKSFDHIKITLANLSSATYTLDTLMTTEKSKLKIIFSNAESITKNIENNNEQITNILQNFSDISDTIAQSNITSVIYEADAALSQLNKITTKC